MGERALCAPAVTLIAERCTGCGLCATACPCGAVALDARGRPTFACAARCTGDPNCVACRVGFNPCQAVCEADAIVVAFGIRSQEN